VSPWLVEQGPLGNAHVIPAEQQGTEAEHELSVGCWCGPRRADPNEPDLMGGDVYLHRRTHDHGHDYRDGEEPGAAAPHEDSDGRRETRADG